MKTKGKRKRELSGLGAVARVEFNLGGSSNGGILFLALLAVMLMACNKDGVLTEDIPDSQRMVTTTSRAEWNRVYEYTPAPGQFIGEEQTGGFTGQEYTPADAVAYAERRLTDNLFVSLGGFGGYIVVGFDHSIVNTGNYDFAIMGNPIDGGSEPGIVWVMQDENGNGLPDDTWYELAGSETGLPGTIRNYAVTYYRPQIPKTEVKWTDNQGKEGSIDYLKAYHKQDYYYPAWIESDSYTLTGTCLEARNYDRSGRGIDWVLPTYDWGYADNFSPTDRLGIADDKNAHANHFKISHAIDAAGRHKELRYIDFVKVQTALNTKSGWLGECSTEVFDFYDYSIRQE